MIEPDKARIAVLGAGAFGTALAISLASAGRDVTLWGRSEDVIDDMRAHRENRKRLKGKPFPDGLRVTSDLAQACRADVILLSVPMQQLAEFTSANAGLLKGKALVSCCKGVDLKSNRGPVALLGDRFEDRDIAILSGPSFAVDIADGLPTALTLATCDTASADALQHVLTTRNIRVYTSLDPVGVEFGGALKNVMAIACGITVGAGFGESARAALMTRGYAEMQRLAAAMGADPDTLAGLSGFGDLVLTCTSEKSRNYTHGLRLGRGDDIDQTVTVEGVATARAVAHLSQQMNLDMPITRIVTDILDGTISIENAVDVLLSRPLKRENQ